MKLLLEPAHLHLTLVERANKLLRLSLLLLIHRLEVSVPGHRFGQAVALHCLRGAQRLELRGQLHLLVLFSDDALAPRLHLLAELVDNLLGRIDLRFALQLAHLDVRLAEGLGKRLDVAPLADLRARERFHPDHDALQRRDGLGVLRLAPLQLGLQIALGVLDVRLQHALGLNRGGHAPLQPRGLLGEASAGLEHDPLKLSHAVARVGPEAERRLEERLRRLRLRGDQEPRLDVVQVDEHVEHRVVRDADDVEHRLEGGQVGIQARGHRVTLPYFEAPVRLAPDDADVLLEPDRLRELVQLVLVVHLPHHEGAQSAWAAQRHFRALGVLLVAGGHLDEEP
mmetsp:Transcript_27334/g.83085  ORF Transcript_27334/g.83085 Transcript_27334/m.83085 type:complete len:340 (-) Transcript_27334:1919-2938(-)